MEWLVFFEISEYSGYDKAHLQNARNIAVGYKMKLNEVLITENTMFQPPNGK